MKHIRTISAIELDYRLNVQASLSSGQIQNIISYQDYIIGCYSSQYKEWVVTAIASGDLSTILSIDDWISQYKPSTKQAITIGSPNPS